MFCFVWGDVSQRIFYSPRMRSAVRPSLLRKEGEKKGKRRKTPLFAQQRGVGGESTRVADISTTHILLTPEYAPLFDPLYLRERG
jgi:hypothetical protein